jgi:hypothetical protein
MRSDRITFRKPATETSAKFIDPGSCEDMLMATGLKIRSQEGKSRIHQTGRCREETRGIFLFGNRAAGKTVKVLALLPAEIG